MAVVVTATPYQTIQPLNVIPTGINHAVVVTGLESAVTLQNIVLVHTV